MWGRMASACHSLQPRSDRHVFQKPRQHGLPAFERRGDNHPLRHDAAHLPRLQVHDEQCLPANEFLRIRALLFHTGEDDALVIAEAHAQLQQLVATTAATPPSVVEGRKRVMQAGEK